MIQNYISETPDWVTFSFIILYPLNILFVIKHIKTGAENSDIPKNITKRYFNSVLIFLFVYLIYTSILSLQGILTVNNLPPRVMLLTTLPFMLFLFIFVYKSSVYWKILKGISLESLVFIHIFRLIGVYFLFATYFKSLPIHFGILAGVGDILAGLGAIYISYIIRKGKSWSKNATIIWNYFGIAEIILVVMSALITTNFSIKDSNIQSVVEITKFPYVWFPSSAPVFILFLHAAIFQKLKLNSIRKN
jgi:hypothetical protein